MIHLNLTLTLTIIFNNLYFNFQDIVYIMNFRLQTDQDIIFLMAKYFIWVFIDFFYYSMICSLIFSIIFMSTEDYQIYYC